MQSVGFAIPGASARVNYRLPVEFAWAVLARVHGEGSGSLWTDFQEERDPYCAHILYGHKPVASFVYVLRFEDGTTKGYLVSKEPEFFEMLRQALEEFLLETQMVPT